MSIDYRTLLDKTEENLVAILGEDATELLLMDCGTNAIQCVREFHPELVNAKQWSEDYDKAIAEWAYKSLDGVFEYHNMPEEVYKAIA